MKKDKLLIIEQMFCDDEGILSKFNIVNIDTIEQWLDEKEYTI